MKVKAKSIVHDHIVDDYNHRGLTPGATYHVVGVDTESFRVVDDNGEPLLYSKDLFDIVDSSLPSDWVVEKTEDEFGENTEYFSKSISY